MQDRSACAIDVHWIRKITTVKLVNVLSSHFQPRALRINHSTLHPGTLAVTWVPAVLEGLRGQQEHVVHLRLWLHRCLSLKGANCGWWLFTHMSP